MLRSDVEANNSWIIVDHDMIILQIIVDHHSVMVNPFHSWSEKYVAAKKGAKCQSWRGDHRSHHRNWCLPGWFFGSGWSSKHYGKLHRFITSLWFSKWLFSIGKPAINGKLTWWMIVIPIGPVFLGVPIIVWLWLLLWTINRQPGCKYIILGWSIHHDCEPSTMATPYWSYVVWFTVVVCDLGSTITWAHGR